MKKIYLHTISLIILSALFTNSNYAQISIQAAPNATDMAQTLAGPGITVLNAQMGGQCPLTVQNLQSGNGRGAGKFSYSGTSNIGIDSGIVLTSGNASAIPNSPTGFYDGYLPNGYLGDATLNSYIGQNNTQDACILEFDMIPTGNHIQFNYVFASREYPNFNCTQYNDIFAFFLSGPGIPTGLNNIALVPGTAIPVRINSVNDGTVGISGGQASNCSNMGPGAPFTQYFVDNSNNQFPNFYYTGFTTVLTAESDVNACDTYHLRLSIADVSDESYDSGVFLKAGSLISDSTITVAPVSAPGANQPTIPHCVRGCNSGLFTFTRPNADPNPLIIDYLISGTAINGTDYTTIPTSITIPANQISADLVIEPLLAAAPTGPRTVTIQVINQSTGCGPAGLGDSSTITIYDSLFVDIPNLPIVSCNTNSVSITAEIDTNLNYTWSPTPNSVSTNGNQVTALVNIPPATYTITVTQPGAPTTCPPNSRSFTAIIPAPVEENVSTQICQGQNYNFNGTLLNTSGNYTDTFQTALGCDSIVHLQLTVADAIQNTIDTSICEGQSIVINGQTYNNSTQINDTLTSSGGCDSIVHINVIVNPSKQSSLFDTICAGSTYTWENQSYTATGNYQQTFSSNTGCDSVATLHLFVKDYLRGRVDSTICPGEYFIWQGQKITRGGVYNDTIPNLDGCDSILSLHLSYYPRPQVAIELVDGDISYCIGQEINLKGHGALHYTWWNEIETTWDGAQVSIPLNHRQNKIWLAGTDLNNCADTVSISVHAEACCRIFVPNAFSPNGDGLNDAFKVVSAGAMPEYHLQIINRYGQTIFQSYRPSDVWDGTFAGKKCELGVYFYLLNGKCVDGTVIKTKGEINLIR